MELAGKTQREMAEIVGVSAPTFNEWINAKKFPRIDKVEKLAAFFGIRKSDLIEDKASVPGGSVDDLDKEIYRLFSQLSPEQKQQAVSKLQELIDKQ